jgi:hypothetical protein
VADLSNACYQSMTFALSKRERPLLILDNHNVVEPTSWVEDPLFSSMRSAWKGVNTVARSQNVDPSGVLVVLKEDAADYKVEELASLVMLIEEATSDIWFMSFAEARRHAAPYLDEDVVVVGDSSVLKIAVKGHAPGTAMGTVRGTDERTVVSRIRGDLLSCTQHAFQVKVKGALRPALRGIGQDTGRMRQVISDVISERTEPPI